MGLFSKMIRSAFFHACTSRHVFTFASCPPPSPPFAATSSNENCKRSRFVHSEKGELSFRPRKLGGHFVNPASRKLSSPLLLLVFGGDAT